MTPVDPADVLAILEERPYLEEELIALFDAPASTLRSVLTQLFRARQLKRVGADRRWALAAYQAPVARPHLTKPVRVQREVDDVDEELEDALDDDAEDLDVAAVDEEEELDTPAAGRTLNRDKLLGASRARIYPAGTRQPKLPKDIATGPGWWVAHAAPGQRDDFMKAAAKNNAEKCATQPSTWRSPREVRKVNNVW